MHKNEKKKSYSPNQDFFFRFFFFPIDWMISECNFFFPFCLGGPFTVSKIE